MQLPNALWISILVAATTIVNQYYGSLWWAPVIVAALAAIAKLIQVTTTDPTPPTSTTRDIADNPPLPPSAFRRWLVG